MHAGFVVVHSVAGGTGSGLGSAITEQLRADYPAAFLLSVAVLPFRSGESPLQHYNMVLCLAALHATSDCVMTFCNDDVLAVLQRRHGKAALNPNPGSGVAQRQPCVSMHDINSHIAASVLGALLPTSPGCLQCVNLWDTCSALVAMPQWKFTTCTTNSAHSSVNRQRPPPAAADVVGRVARTLARHVGNSQEDLEFVPVYSVATQITARGAASRDMDAVSRSVAAILNHVPWNPFPIDTRLCTCKISPERCMLWSVAVTASIECLWACFPMVSLAPIDSTSTLCGSLIAVLM